jgi:hypothetical protein
VLDTICGGYRTLVSDHEFVDPRLARPLRQWSPGSGDCKNLLAAAGVQIKALRAALIVGHKWSFDRI